MANQWIKNGKVKDAHGIEYFVFRGKVWKKLPWYAPIYKFIKKMFNTTVRSQ